MSDMKILVLDIETSPNLVYAWGLWQQNISISQIVQPTYVMSWAAKWLGKKEVIYREVYDSDFLTCIWGLMDEADAIVHFNGTAFDIKHLHREFLTAGLTKPLKAKNIDLLKTVREQFKFPSNKLDYVAQEVLGEKKMQHEGMPLWIGCMNDEWSAWQTMRKYNIQDVRLTEKLYMRLRGWIKGHPNHGLYIEDQEHPVCRACGSERVGTKGWQRLNVQSYMRYRCKDCGWQGRGRKRVQGGPLAKQVLA